MSSIESTVEKTASYAEFHASNCSKILEELGLADTLIYCENQNIDPPTMFACSTI